MARILQTDSIETSTLIASQVKLALGTPAAPSLCGSSDENTGLVFDNNDKIGLSTGGVRRLTILPNGNIGVGVENPATLLEINGNLKANSATITTLTTTLAGAFTIINGQASITNGSVDTNQLANQAITTLKIQDSAITNDKIADNTISNDKILDGTITTTKLNTDSVASLTSVQSFTKQHNFTAQELTDSAYIYWNLDDAQVAYITLKGNRFLSSPANQRQGGIYILVIKQDDVGGRSISFSSDYIFPDNIDVQLNGVANRLDILSFISIGGKMYGTFALNYMIG
jgi:hypothetical protein